MRDWRFPFPSVKNTDDKTAAARRTLAIIGRRDCEQPQLRNRADVSHRRDSAACRFRNSTAKRIQSGRRDRFRSGDGDAVPYIDNLSRVATRQDQASLPSVRSLGNLPSNCRHVYTLRTRSLTWCMGLDALWRYLVSCYPRHRLQSFWRLEISIALNFVVHLYGLDCIVRHSPILAACRIPRIVLDYIWRPCLHLRSRVLLGEASPIQPFDLAPFRERGNSLSFLRRPLVCRVGRESRTPKQGESG